MSKVMASLVRVAATAKAWATLTKSRNTTKQFSTDSKQKSQEGEANLIKGHYPVDVPQDKLNWQAAREPTNSAKKSERGVMKVMSSQITVMKSHRKIRVLRTQVMLISIDKEQPRLLQSPKLTKST